ncbi:hypothetical protein [Paracraurococcus lichenis]|uniref:Lipoprotein n=1 Tax=Paracraurococcus lichenis TaxID=3064888 RepID=A0ABT9E332_9PROT|nr:hypothetical protein [Paracraurococcus sp. LOR1-02]MDO9710574.1 hypothetical protein [Paracraurococcus sp. LOR1-02]
MRNVALFLLIALTLPACVVRREVSAPPAYSQASPYAAPVARDGYCAESIAQAQDAAARAAVTGSGRDANRADRTASYARRDC